MNQTSSEVTKGEEERIIAKWEVEELEELAVAFNLVFGDFIDGAIDKIYELHLLRERGDLKGDGRFV